MKGKLFKKALAVATSVLMLSGGVSAQPFADIFKDMAITANAETTTSTINISGTDYTLFTGFTATGGNGMNYAKLVDGNTSTDWIAAKSYGEVTNHFNGGTADPAFVEFHADEPIVPKGYVLTCDHENAGFWKPVEWALKAKLNEGDEWTTIQSSTTTLGAGKTFEIACDNNGDNQYQYFRFEVYEVGLTHTVDLDELQIYGSLPAYTHLTVKAATCMATGIKQECYRRNSDGKYFTDETGATELAESDVIAPIAAHTGVHHEATDTHIEYWQCSMCSKYFSNEDCTTEITEEDTKIYRTITIDNSISGLVTVGFGKTKALAGETVYLYISDLIDASTLKVNDGAVKLTAVTDIQYTFTMPAADVTVTADVAQSNVDSDILTGSIRHTVTIADGANITLNNATISGSIICEGSATITLVGTNSVSGADKKAGIQIGGSGTTLTIRGDGSLTANGGSQSAGIGLSRIWNYDSNVSSGDIVIEGGTITTTGGNWGAGIGTGVVKNTNNNNSTSVQFGNITIKGGSVTAIGGDSGDGIGKGYAYSGPTITIGTVTIYDGIDKVDASSIKDFGSVVYMHGESDVTASKSDYFTIIENGNRLIIVQKVTPTIADVPDQTYTGSAITPEPTVIAGSLNLTKGTDYVYSYTNNTNFGTATVRATFRGDYASLGYVEKEFTILPPPVVVNVTGNGTVTYNDKSAASGETIGVTAEKGTDVTLTLTPENGYAVRSVEYGYTNSNEMTTNGAKLPINGTTATLTVPNDLKDGTYVNLTVTFVSALAGGADEASAVALTDNTVTNFAGGWYKVDSDITFDHTLNLLGDTHLIIDDGKTMTVNTATSEGILSDYTLFVSGDGALSVTTTADYGIAVVVRNYVQTDATVTASGYIGIRCTDDFIAFNFDNDFTFSGGQLTATGSGGGGIDADNDITLSCTNATDFIQASSYRSAHGAVKIAEGKALTDGTSTYTGILTGDDLKAISGQTLVAAEVENTRNIISGANVTLGGELGLNFYLTVPDAVKDAGAKVVMNGPNSKKEVTLSTLTKDADGKYKITYKLNAVQSNENVTLKIVDANNETLKLYGSNGSELLEISNDTFTYSIKTYLENACENSSLSDSQKEQIKAVYTYCAYSAWWDKGEPLPDAKYINTLPSIKSDNADLTDHKLAVSGAAGGVNLTGFSLVLDSKTSIKLYFTVSDNDIEKHIVKIGDKTLKPVATSKEDGGLTIYYVEIPDIAANQLESKYTIVFDDAYTVTVSALSYVYNILKIEETTAGTYDAKLVDLVRAIYDYAEKFKNL